MSPARLLRIVLAWALMSALVSAGSAAPLSAQGRLLDTRVLDLAPQFESWHFGDGLPQADLGSAPVRVRRATQLSLPWALSVPFGERWAVDVDGAYAVGRVGLTAADPDIGRDRYALSGLTDVRVRLSGHLVGDRILLTLGGNIPTGRTSFDLEQLRALYVLAAPALGFQTPVLGSGAAGTAGLVFTQPSGPWVWALGASYEVHGGYSPVALAAGLPALDFKPSNAARVSAGGDLVFGEHQMSLGVSAEIYGTDRLTARDVAGAPASGAAADARKRLGPILTAEWRLRLGAAGLRELTLYAVDRYRTAFSREGSTVAGSSGNHLDAGIRALTALGRTSGLLTAVAVRHQTGLSVDNSIATAALFAGGVTVGYVREIGNGYVVQPFARGQIGRFRSGLESVTGTDLGAGISLRALF